MCDGGGRSVEVLKRQGVPIGIGEAGMVVLLLAERGTQDPSYW